MISFIAQTVAENCTKQRLCLWKAAAAEAVGTWGSAGKVPKPGVPLFRKHTGILTPHETKINVSHMR